MYGRRNQIFIHILYILKIPDQTKNGLQDDRCEGLLTNKGQTLVFDMYTHIYIYTHPKINIEPEKDDFPVPGVYSQVPC